MWSTRLRYPALGILLLGVIAALLLTWRVSHVLFVSFAIAVGFIILSVAIVGLARDGWRQTSPEDLGSRGFRPGTSGIGVMDPGLRRDYSPILPAAVTRRRTGTRAPRRAVPSAVPLAAVAKPARSGRTRRRKAPTTCSSSWTLN